MHSFVVSALAALVTPVTALAFPSGQFSSPITTDGTAAALSGRPSSMIDVTFHELVMTSLGESIILVGSIEALGAWNASNGVPLSADRYTASDPLWRTTVRISQETSFQYKYVRVGADGSLNWEGSADHSYTVPGSGVSVTILDTWQSTNQVGTPSALGYKSRAISSARHACSNSPQARRCWSDGYSIDTNVDSDWPNTGNTVTYDLAITNTTLAPDGYQRQVFAINGRFPGPTIYANWGDTISVTVHNQLENNGTSMHWHGMRLFHKNTMDGVPGVTECPIAPGQSKTYTFQATQHGTSWYHSHFSAQYGDGVWGPIVIHGPASANYDIELGPLPVQDWYYSGVYSAAARAQNGDALPPEADNGLINGTMISSFGGNYARTILTAGKKHRLRLLNTGIDNHFMFSLDSHTFTVIAADFVPVVPYDASWIFMGVGQRYDVIITADQAPGSYWFRAEVQDTAGCGSNFQNGKILSIFSYKGSESTTPTSSASDYTQRCTDETKITPYQNLYTGSDQVVSKFMSLDTAINQSTAADGSLSIYWQVNGAHMVVDWAEPTLVSIRNSHTDWNSSQAVIQLGAEVWTYWIITEGRGSPFTINVPHPIHLHGHDFYVLGSGLGAWSESKATDLNYRNPPRRDVAMLPGGGWLALAFFTNNPGAWLMHCHIAWHADEGFAVQFVENQSNILSVDPLSSDFDNQCRAWQRYESSNTVVYHQIDSGI